MSTNSRGVWQPDPTTKNAGQLDISTYSVPPAVTAPSVPEIIGQNEYPWSEYVCDEPVAQGSLPGFTLGF